MAELLFDAAADAQLSRLEADPATERLAGKVHSALDRLEEDPGAAECRRRRFASIGLWAMVVIDADEEWLILWEPGVADDVVVVQAIIPAP